MQDPTHRWRKRLSRVGVTLFAIALIAYFGLSAYAAYKVTHPIRMPLHTTPEVYGMKYESVTFPSVPDGVLLKGWFIDSPRDRTILVLHGESSARDNYINMEVGRRLYEHGYDLCMFDFRAHGESGGDTGSIGDLETRDVAGALAYLKGRGIDEVGAIGWSMGAATIINSAPDHPEIAAIVADSSFSNLMSMVDIERGSTGAPGFLDPGIVLVTRLMYGTDISANEPRRATGRLGNRPVLLIHANGDNMIPVEQAQELAEAGADDPNLQLWIVPSVGHVSSFSASEDEYAERVFHFFDNALGGPGVRIPGSEGSR